MLFAITSTRGHDRKGGAVLLSDGKKARVRALPDQRRGHPPHTQFDLRRSVVRAIAFGAIAFGGVTGRAATIDDMPFGEALRYAVPVGPVMAALALAISWLIRAFDQRFSGRADGTARGDSPEASQRYPAAGVTTNDPSRAAAARPGIHRD